MFLQVACPHCARPCKVASARGARHFRCGHCSRSFLVRGPAVLSGQPATPHAGGASGAHAGPPRGGRSARRWVFVAAGGAVLALLAGAAFWLILAQTATPLRGEVKGKPNDAAAGARPAVAAADLAAAKPPAAADPGKPPAATPAPPADAGDKVGGARPVAAGLTPENFAKIKSGMTEADVKAILGEPNRALDFNQAIAQLAPPDRPDDPRMRFLIWEHGRDQARVGFLDDRAALLSAVFPDQERPRPALPPAVTEENFRKLRYGMSLEDALRILGPPTHRQDIVVAEYKGAALVWMEGKDSIDCRFSNGGLTSAVAGVAGRVL